MTWTDVWNGIDKAFQWCFRILEWLHQKPNIFLWVLIFVLLIVWVSQMSKQNKEAAKNGTLK